MTPDGLIDQLAEHRTLGRAPREELAWLAGHGSVRQLNPGDILTAKGKTVAGMFIVLSGRIAIFIDRGAGPRKTMEWLGGDVTGLLPYSRLTSPPADTVAQEPTVILQIDRECLRDLVLECHEITTLLVHAMLDRARMFTSSDLHDEKMVSLGKLAAGLAHELNNPASAIERSATLLDDRLDEAQLASRALGAARLTDAQLEAIDALRTACVVPLHGVRSPVEQAAHEEAIADWLIDHGVEAAIADALAETGVTQQALDDLARAITGPPLAIALRWAASGCSVHRLAAEIQEAAMRVSGLVTSIKGFTHMDQAPVAEPVDVLQGLSNTIAVLQSKARGKSAAVAVSADADLPHIYGFAGELNQVWANLIDNALDAVAHSGRVEVVASREGRQVAVRIIDNGSGIPDEIRDRIFDPFFTTKPVGSGTGLGLDIVRRLVRHNQGDISVVSRPGRTEFCVVLPAAGAEPGAPA
jgi:signal transduction histidine kinase